VSNILADDEAALTYDNYNATLEEFHERFTLPAAQTVGAEIQLRPPDPRIEDFVSTSTADLLRSFSGLADKSILDSMDRKRWNEFLTAAHREGARLSPSMLQQWLIEEENWPEAEAANLATEYEHARELLGVYGS